MIVECSIQELLKLVGKKLTVEELEESLFLLKAEVEKIEGDLIEIEINPDRQDMLSTEGIARALRAFLGISPGLPKFPVKTSNKKVIVQNGLERIRRFIACGTVKDVTLNDYLLKEYMHLQEALTATHGRNRRKASIGLYVYDDISFPVIYKAEKPETIKFVPLGYDIEMDGPTILREHEKGIEFGPIIKDFKRWPLLMDSSGKILSLPPIINSNDLGRVTENTKNIFVEVTGTHLPTVEQALNIMITSLAERGGKIESVTVEYPDNTTMRTPNLKPQPKTLSVQEVNQLTGLQLSASEIVTCLEKMCYGAKLVGTSKIRVSVPAFRADILHPVDIIEDVAIGYGFDNITPTLPSTMTTGSLRPLTRLKNKCRDLLIGAGYQEVLSYIMTSPEILNAKMLRNQPMVKTGNPKSQEYSVLRNSLLPILIDFASQNQHADYPQKIFEVGDIVLPDAEKETRVLQLTAVSGLITDSRVNLTDLMIDVAFLLRGMGLENLFQFKTREDPTFISGRAGTILVDGEEIGYFGEISPEVLINFSMVYPIVAFEIVLPETGIWHAN